MSVSYYSMSQLYILFALVAGFLWGVSVYLDKVWVMPQVKSDIVIGLSAGILSPIYFFPLIFTEYVTVPEIVPLIYAGLTGVLYTVALYFYVGALRRDDPAVVSPMFRLAPVFTVILAALFLGQILSTQIYIGIIIVLLGVFLVSINKRTIVKFELSPAIAYAVMATLLVSIGNVFIEFALLDMNVWTYLYWSRIIGIIPAVIMLLLPSSRACIKELINAPKKTFSIFVTKTIDIIGIVFYSIAVALGPVAIVSTLTSLETVFVMLIVMFVSFYKKQPIPMRKLVRDATASILVVIGVVFIYV